MGNLLDIVALDLPQYNLCRGQVGTVVEVLSGGAACEVEFSDRDGRTYESLGLHPEQIMVLAWLKSGAKMQCDRLSCILCLTLKNSCAS
jgi:Domain of unknown function (DUF4926)